MKKILFLSILVIAFMLRVYNLNSIPSGFYNDEASFLVNAISIAQTGKDEDGKSFPLLLRSYIDPKPALYSYAEIPFISVLGVTPMAARLPAVLFGMVSLVLFYFLLKQLVDEKVALVGQALLSISPWHIDLSRGTQEVIMAFCFSLATIYFFLLLHKPKPKTILYIFFFLSLLLSLYSYPSIKVFLPIVLTCYIFLEGLSKKITIKKSLLLLCITMLGVVAMFPLTDLTRFNAVSIFTNQQTQLVLNEKIRTATPYASGVAIRIFNNKLIDYAYTFLSNYVVYFSGNFLFFGENEPLRYKIPFTGMLFPIEIIFLIVGIFYSFSNKKLRQAAICMAIWLLAAPIPASLTSQEIPSITRSFLMLVPLLCFISVGILRCFEIVKRQKFLWILGMIGVILIYSYSVSYFWFNYTIQQGSYHPWYRNYEDTKVANTVLTIKNRYKKIYISHVSYTYFVLNKQISIQDLQKSYPHRLSKIFSIGKFIFINQDCYFLTEKNSLFAVKDICKLGRNQSKDYELVDVVRFKDNIAAYNLYTYAPLKIPIANLK